MLSPWKDQKILVHTVQIHERGFCLISWNFSMFVGTNLLFTQFPLFVRTLLKLLNPCPSSLFIAIFCLNIKNFFVNDKATINSFCLFTQNRKNLFTDPATPLTFSSCYVLFPPRNPANRKNCPETAEIFINFTPINEFHFALLNFQTQLQKRHAMRWTEFPFIWFCFPWSSLTERKKNKLCDQKHTGSISLRPRLILV